MSFKKFDLLILLQICLLVATSIVIAWAMVQEELKISVIYFTIVLIIQVILLFRFIRENNRGIIRFLDAVKYRDDLSKLSEDNTRNSHLELRKLLNQIAASYSKVKIEKESEHYYFLNTIKHVNIGLISFDRKGKIELVNEATERLLRVRHPVHLSQLRSVSPDFDQTLQNLQPGKPLLLKISRKDEILPLSLTTTQFIVNGNTVKLVSLQDIRNEIQQEEIEIWKKLIRVLTHEIMNSAGPITSLSSTLTQAFREEIKSGEPFSEPLYQQMLTGLQAIEKRSRGLSKFVETYRSLTKIPKPVFNKVEVADLLGQIQMLMKSEIEKAGVLLSVDLHGKHMVLMVDEKLISQVLINLVRNSLEAIKPAGVSKIEISAYTGENSQTIIRVEDNGSGMPPDVLEKVFIPFFTTRDSGNGIGLSLTRQIMHLHGGTVSIKSFPDEGTTVDLNF